MGFVFSIIALQLPAVIVSLLWRDSYISFSKIVLSLFGDGKKHITIIGNSAANITEQFFFFFFTIGQMTNMDSFETLGKKTSTAADRTYFHFQHYIIFS